MPETESTAGAALWGLPGWMGGKLLSGILRGNRTTNQAGIDAFRDRSRATLNPKPAPASPAPVVPQPPTVDQATASPYERNEPTRGRARKAKPKRK